MFVYPTTQPIATNSRERAAESAPADLDPAIHPIISKHWFGIEPLRPIGPIAAEVVAGLRFRRKVQRLHRLGDRVLAEALAHLGAKHGIQTSVERTVEHFAEIDPEALEVAGGDDFWQSPFHGVES